MKFGDRIKQRRNELHMSAGELGSLIGKNRATIYRYESGDIENVPLEVLEPLAEALDLMPEYLLGWTNSNHVGSIIKESDVPGMVYVRMREDMAREYESWCNIFGSGAFTQDEFKKLVDYAKFLIYLRDK